MRRGEYFPIYRPSQLGGKRTKPFTRPAKDSLPHFECETPGCGTHDHDRAAGILPLSLFDYGDRTAGSYESRWFCSWGCLGRFAALQELRS